MSSEKYILSEKGKPFTIRAAAQIRAETITEETGIAYRAKQIDEGFVVVPCSEKEKEKEKEYEISTPMPGSDYGDDISKMDEIFNMKSDEPEFLKSSESELERKNEQNHTSKVIDEMTSKEEKKPRKPKNQQIVSDIHFRPAWRGMINYHLMAFIGVMFALFNRNLLSIAMTPDDMIEMQTWYTFWDVLQATGFAMALYAFTMSTITVYFFKYTLTAKSVGATEGVISRKKPSIGLDDVNKNELVQTALERILDIGTIELSTAGTGGVDLYLRGISSPVQMQDLLKKRIRG